MPYMIRAYDRPDTQDLRQALRATHLQFLDDNKALLLACGALLDDEGAQGLGSLYVVNLDSRAEAEAFVAGDPYAQGGLFERVDVVRWRKAYLGGECFL